MDVDKTAINKIVVLNVTTENTITIHCSVDNFSS